MKIAIFSDCYLDLTGGITSSINAQKSALEALGHEVEIFSSGYPRTDEELKKLAKDHIYMVPSCKYFFRGATPVSRRPSIVEPWLLENHPELKEYDIFYIHYEAGCSIAGIRLAKKLKIPSVQVMHGREDMGETNIIPFGFRTFVAFMMNWSHSWYIPHRIKIKPDGFYADSRAKAKMWEIMVNHANSADLVLTPSEHFREKLMRYGVKKDIKVFPNGYPDARFPKNPTTKSLKPGEELKIIWHSRVSGEKRIMPFLKALNLLNAKYQMDVYGGGGDLKKAERYVKKHNLNVKFRGTVPFSELADSIGESHLDVLASYNFDTFGMTLIEAEAYGVPVFICDPDLEEVVPEGSYVISRNENPEEMAEALQNLLKYPEEINRMSKIMLKHRKDVLISRRIKKLEKIFKEIIKK